MEVVGVLPYYHTLIEAFLMIWVAWYIFRKRKNSFDSIPSNELVQSKLAEWQPEPLISEPPRDHPSLSPRYITSRVGKRITVDSKDCLNLGRHDYLGLSYDPKIDESAVIIGKGRRVLMLVIEKLNLRYCTMQQFNST